MSVAAHGSVIIPCAAPRHSSVRRQRRGGALVLAYGLLLALAQFCPPLAGIANAIEAIGVDPDAAKMEITTKGELYEGRGDRLQIETASGPDGVATTTTSQVDDRPRMFVAVARSR